MILHETYTKQWIEGFRNQFKTADTGIIEKMIFALSLLEELANQKVEFIFKGGTALVLLYEKTLRFSTDIDIITTLKPEIIENILNNIIANSKFTNWKLDEKRSFISNIPKAHYKMFFVSPISNKENLILLDVLFEENPYPEILNLPIASIWLKTEEPYNSVQIPTLESILGDKITAFAPNTTGIKYQNEKDLEIVKQLFDVSNLIDISKKLDIVKKSFVNSALKEISYRKLSITTDDIFEDIFQTTLLLARNSKIKDEPDKSKFDELQNGIKKLNNHLAERNFRLEQAIEASAKTAWFTEILKQNKFDEFILYSEKININDWLIQNTEYNFINRFKKTNKTAFYYWYKCLEIKKLLDVS